jgi:hypothetical protein
MRMLPIQARAAGTNIGVAIVAVARNANTVDHDRRKKLWWR